MNRKGEKIGWIVGWTGGFLWILPFAAVCFFQERLIYGVFSVVLFLLALFSIVKFAPWKYPDTKYWKLMIPMYSILLISVVLVLYVFNIFNEPARLQYGLWILPCLSPFVILGNREWGQDGQSS